MADYNNYNLRNTYSFEAEYKNFIKQSLESRKASLNNYGKGYSQLPPNPYRT
jgi:hypothetical protein